MTERGILVVFSGPSGVGKDTVLERFLPTAENCVRSISATTRPPREGEQNGRDYFFLTREEFGGLAARGEMLEYTEYNGNYYGTPKKPVEEMLADGRNVVLKIEVDGALQVKRLHPDAVLVFVAPPTWEMLEERLKSRGTESREALERRLATARFELSKADRYDYIIVNDKVEDCCERLRTVVSAAGYSAAHMKTFIEALKLPLL